MKAFSEATRKKMSESAKRRCSDPAWLEAQHARATPLPLDTVTEMYLAGHTQKEIAEALGVTQKVVWRFMKNHNLKARTSAKRSQYAENNDNWRGGKVIDDHGYRHVKKEGHPRAKKCGSYVREHILIAESILGRALTDNEVVHHINGVKTDNRPENLSVMTKAEHTHYHSCKRRGKEVAEPKPITL